MRRKIGIGLVVVCFNVAAVGLIVTEGSEDSQPQSTTLFSTPLPAGGTFGVHLTFAGDTPGRWLLVPLGGGHTGVVLLLWPLRREGRLKQQHRSGAAYRPRD